MPSKSDFSAMYALLSYWYGLVLCLHLGRPYASLSASLPALPPEARLQIYSLCLHLRLWSLPHYRSGTFANDMRKNLRNVALPGTGLALSYLCTNYLVAVLFLWIGVPLAAFAAAIVRVRGEAVVPPPRGLPRVGLFDAFAEALLACGNGGRAWFHYWRLNCALASYHALKTSDDGYALEDKLTFLQACEREGVAVSPWLRHPRLVVKHRNEEGGLGLHTYNNADAGGDWIIQQWLENDAGIARLLPPNAPLSTLRLITASKASAKPSTHVCAPSDVMLLSACFRAGREGAMTDHSCIMFDVDVQAGRCRNGTSNAHWYQLGFVKALSCPWYSLGHTIASHPDSGRAVAGEPIPDMASCVKLVTEAHRKLMPRVPLVGWDVAITKEHGMLLLEANLSCNFFRATFDTDKYAAFVEEVLGFLEEN